MDFDIEIFLENMIYLNREFNNVCITPTIDFLINRNIINIDKDSIIELEKTLRHFKPDGYFTEIGKIIMGHIKLLKLHTKFSNRYIIKLFLMKIKFEFKINKILNIDDRDGVYYDSYEKIRNNVVSIRYNYLKLSKN